MSQIYVAYDVETLHHPEMRSIGADTSLARLISNGILLRRSEAYIFLCSIDNQAGSRPKVKREAFVGTFCPVKEEFKPADQVLTRWVGQTAS